MAITADIRKAFTDSTPLYAVAGAGDLAVEKLREVPAKLATVRAEPKVVQQRVTDAQAKVQERVNSSLNTVAGDLRTLPEKAQSFALSQVGKANEAYEDLAARGKNVVGRIRRQKASQDLKAEAHTTASKAKATEQSARRAVSSTQRSAKATATSASKTAKAAERATRDAADKIG
jgi:heparin binding hemagglutinin HbhA